MRLPARVEPVKEIMSTSGCFTSASPAAAPEPVTRLNTPFGRPGGLDHLGEDEGVERRHLGGLEHHGAARGERRRDLERDLVQRIVPRRDRADHADRLAHHQRVADLFLERELPQRVFA